ncbi:hypothetical protein ABZ741_39270 [Streptomyces globisporus]|uniref:hypothetical protein n=1 Tax=Streptomyces globisporus TaxID=1908 RepID=UPI0034612B01|nr:hypothetical protein OG838_09610 [Streptomyces globisporus]WSV89508.1 hypothetical protein OG449_09185 [Streptomyces globisporus]
MSNTRDHICERDGCRWNVALVMVADMALPTRYCGEACADYAYLARGLAAMEQTPRTLAMAANLREVGRMLDSRSDPTDVDRLLDFRVTSGGDLRE